SRHSDDSSWVETYWNVRLGLWSTGQGIQNENFNIEDLASGLKKFVEFFSTHNFEYCHSVIKRLLVQVKSIHHENQIEIFTQLFIVLSQRNEVQWKELIQELFELIYNGLGFHDQDREHQAIYQEKREKWIQQVLSQRNHQIFDQFFQSGSTIQGKAIEDIAIANYWNTVLKWSSIHFEKFDSL